MPLAASPLTLDSGLALAASLPIARRRSRLAPAALAAVLVAACGVPDRPGGLAPPLAQPALEMLEPDTLRSLRVGDGVFYWYAWSAKGPWAIHMVSADLSRCDVSLAVVPALADGGAARTRRRVSEMSPPPEVVGVAAVNGDFFTPGGRPLGAESTGSAWQWTGRPVFAWRRDGGAWIGAQDEGAGTGSGGDVGMLRGHRPTEPERPGRRVPRPGSDGWQVLGGYPVLLDADQPAVAGVAAARPEFGALRHPRTGIGVDADAERLWMVVVDGRQEPRSAGMTLPELAELMASLGADHALNLDGGGSSTMLLRGRVANRPSDAAGERPVANSLWLAQDRSACTGQVSRRGPRRGTAEVPAEPEPSLASGG